MLRLDLGEVEERAESLFLTLVLAKCKKLADLVVVILVALEELGGHLRPRVEVGEDPLPRRWELGSTNLG